MIDTLEVRTEVAIPGKYVQHMTMQMMREWEKEINEGIQRAFERLPELVKQAAEKEVQKLTEEKIKDYFAWKGKGRDIIDNMVNSTLDSIFENK